MKRNRTPKKSSWRSFTERHRNKGVAAVYIVLRVIVIAYLVLSAIRRDYESVFVCSLVLVLYTLPLFVQKTFRISLPSTLEVIILLFIFAAEILGELQSYYLHFPHWDTILHTTNGFICAAFGFGMIDILNRDSKIKFNLSPLFAALVAFCFSMTIGVLWEFFEFAMDTLFLTDMQKDTVLHTISSTALDPMKENVAVILKDITETAVNGESLGVGGYLDIGLYDTMEDLFVNFIGAAIFSIIGYINIKTRGKSRFARRFIPTIEEDATEETE